MTNEHKTHLGDIIRKGLAPSTTSLAPTLRPQVGDADDTWTDVSVQTYVPQNKPLPALPVVVEDVSDDYTSERWAVTKKMVETERRDKKVGKMVDEIMGSIDEASEEMWDGWRKMQVHNVFERGDLRAPSAVFLAKHPSEAQRDMATMRDQGLLGQDGKQGRSQQGLHIAKKSKESSANSDTSRLERHLRDSASSEKSLKRERREKYVDSNVVRHRNGTERHSHEKTRPSTTSSGSPKDAQGAKHRSSESKRSSAKSKGLLSAWMPGKPGS